MNELEMGKSKEIIQVTLYCGRCSWILLGTVGTDACMALCARPEEQRCCWTTWLWAFLVRTLG